VTDGGQNLVQQVDLATGAFSTVVTFPQIANPIPGFPAFTDAVATGIAHNDGQLLVALFTGVPFPPGQSKVEQVDPLTGSHSVFIGGLKTAIDVRPVREGRENHYLVLQHASPTGPFFPPPGLLLHFETTSGPPTVVSNCLTRPTSMVVDEKTGLTYVTELAGRIIEIAGAL
jgi:hypothetical protein